MKEKKSLLNAVEKFYGADPRELPLYGLSQTARHLKIPLATLRSWIKGRYYPVESGSRFFNPVLKLPDSKVPLLSFFNLVEAHVLSGIRRSEKVPFAKVRRALAYLETAFPAAHPLADYQFQTDGVDLFVERLGELIAVSQAGQIGIKEVLKNYLRRIERDVELKPFKLYPFVRPALQTAEPRPIVIDPLVSFGRPVIAGTGVPTEVIAERFQAGDSAAALARDYGITCEQVEAALSYEAPARAAA